MHSYDSFFIYIFKNKNDKKKKQTTNNKQTKPNQKTVLLCLSESASSCDLSSLPETEKDRKETTDKQQ